MKIFLNCGPHFYVLRTKAYWHRKTNPANGQRLSLKVIIGGYQMKFCIIPALLLKCDLPLNWIITNVEKDLRIYVMLSRVRDCVSGVLNVGDSLSQLKKNSARVSTTSSF